MEALTPQDVEELQRRWGESNTPEGRLLKAYLLATTQTITYTQLELEYEPTGPSVIGGGGKRKLARNKNRLS
jgi:hypothetical protein